MGIRVAKFGGSSVADAIQIEKTKKIIQADKDRKYIVVSAPGRRFEGDTKITDLLYLCKTHQDHNIPYDQLFQVVCDRYKGTEVNLGVDVGIQKYLDVIKRDLQEGVSADYIASRGEFLNAIIIAAYLEYDFIDAADMICFDEKGKFLARQTNETLKKELAKHENAVIPGFYGADPKKMVRTFSRGGSDITGAIVARAIGAEAYENWTDVSGFLMADPRIVPDAKPINTISYKELRELSYMGASVLHEDAIYPARAENIPINIRNTNRPEDEGTLITAEAGPLANDQIITGIAGKKDFTVIALYKDMLSNERGFVRRLAGILEDFDIPLEHLPSGIDTVSVVLSDETIDGRLDDIVEEFKQQLKPNTIEIIKKVSLIATVGCGMSSRPGVSSKLFTALAKAGVNIRMIDQGSSEMNIIVGVENKDFETSIKAIYNAFVK
ncbi:MAG: aspartate kinase [Anaerovoracaceae bacterium]